MRVLNKNNPNNVNEGEDLAAMIENNHEQEDCDNDLSQSMNPSDTHDPQECLKEKGKSILQELKCIPQVMKVNLKIQYLQLNHPRVYFILHTVP